MDINDDCNIALANGVCDVFTEVDSVDPPHQFELTPQIPAGGTVELALSTLNEVPSTVSLGSMELFFTHPISGDPAVQIPIQSVEPTGTILRWTASDLGSWERSAGLIGIPS